MTIESFSLGKVKKDLRVLEMDLRAQKIRRLLEEGFTTGQFLPGHLGLGIPLPDAGALLAWFKHSEFEDSIEALEEAIQRRPWRSFRTHLMLVPK